ncbi:deoxyribose-phosphate aldolase [uncultured Microbacterium sp.]|uniref:deoxyribose-phosphate aldolase n=1 Tax=uncultured Microbacterium sp. TaxID=191216 RepID=UPI0025D97236|nr:deoxyribose-phosphate aldolase [uncultured Microbacterium sp.]
MASANLDPLCPEDLPSEAALAATIDHAILKPEFTRDDVDQQLDIAAEWKVFSVCVRPSDIAYAVRRLDGSGVAVGTVIGFPHGTTSTATKVAETAQALADGASEVDMVVNIGWLRSGFDADVEADIAAVVAAAEGQISKVILETSLLDDEQIARGSRLTDAAGADFVKTSTGFAGGGATAPHVRLMRENVSDRVRVKASGGVHSLADALAMIDAGATRLGTSGSATILGELRAILAGGTASNAVDHSSY